MKLSTLILISLVIVSVLICFYLQFATKITYNLFAEISKNEDDVMTLLAKLTKEK